jgi:hypothetical protein
MLALGASIHALLFFLFSHILRSAGKVVDPRAKREDDEPMSASNTSVSHPPDGYAPSARMTAKNEREAVR